MASRGMRTTVRTHYRGKDALSRRLTVAVAAAVAVTGLTLGVAGPAAAATQQELSVIIKDGTKKDTGESASDAILSGTSRSSIPTGNGEKKTTFLSAFAQGVRTPDVAPPGANNWGCKPAAGQNPVILVHGTWENAYDNWAYISPYLAKAGFCVYALNYGILDIRQGGGAGTLLPGAYGVGDIAQSADQLSSFVDKVLASSGASKVTIVGHSQGGPMARQYLKFDGGAAKVDRLITLGATNHGTTLLGIGALGRFINNAGIDVLGPVALGVGVSGIQQVVGSDFMNALNAGGDTVGGVKYTIIATKYDEITTPYSSTFLTGPNVTNVTLQDGCSADHSDHVSMSYSLRAMSIVLNTLKAKLPLVANHVRVPVPVVCAPNAWLFG